MHKAARARDRTADMLLDCAPEARSHMLDASQLWDKGDQL